MTSRKHQGRTIDTTIRIKSTPLRVWEAWADPQQIANWFVDRAEGQGHGGNTVRWFFRHVRLRHGHPRHGVRSGQKRS